MSFTKCCTFKVWSVIKSILFDVTFLKIIKNDVTLKTDVTTEYIFAVVYIVVLKIIRPDFSQNQLHPYFARNKTKDFFSHVAELYHVETRFFSTSETL